MDELIEFYGKEFLCYVLACEPDELLADNLRTEQIDVFTQLGSLVANLANREPFERQVMLNRAVTATVDDQGTVVANALRAHCGGDSPTRVPVDDECLSKLLDLSLAKYPSLILRFPDGDPLDSVHAGMGSLLGQPAYKEFCVAVCSHDALSLLFPGTLEASIAENDSTRLDTDIVGQMVYSTGRGGSFQLVMLADALLTYAYEKLLLSGERGLYAYLGSVREAFSETCRLAKGRSVEVPVIFGLSNVRLNEGVVIETSAGVIRGVQETDRRFLPQFEKTDIVLVAKTQFQILSKTAWSQDGGGADIDLEKYRPRFEKWQRELNRLLETFRFGMLLASSERPYFATQHISSCVINPLAVTPQTSWRLDALDGYRLPAMETSLDVGLARLTEEWIQKVIDNHPPSLDIAMRRLLSSVTGRIDPIDGFVDSVLAWENMFSGSPETTLKVCGPISLLLEPDDFEVRLRLFKDLKGVYAERSSIVHGGKEPSFQEAIMSRDRAIEIALKAMRKLYDYPELLRIEDAQIRGRDILLGRLNSIHGHPGGLT